MFDKPVTLFQVIALYSAHQILNSKIIAAYISGWMAN